MGRVGPAKHGAHDGPVQYDDGENAENRAEGHEHACARRDDQAEGPAASVLQATPPIDQKAAQRPEHGHHAEADNNEEHAHEHQERGFGIVFHDGKRNHDYSRNHVEQGEASEDYHHASNDVVKDGQEIKVILAFSGGGHARHIGLDLIQFYWTIHGCAPLPTRLFYHTRITRRSFVELTKMQAILSDETARNRAFPITGDGRIFLAHAGVSPLPQAVVDAIKRFADEGARDIQESPWAMEETLNARKLAAQLIGASASEIALLGPTALGLSLVANGIDWQPGDEIVYYDDDYPANVYPWLNTRNHGVKLVKLKPEWPGVLTWDVVEAALTARTRLVTLASCNFLSGFRIDPEGIGRKLHERGILLCLDGIQTLGAFPLDATHVDFVSADAHKWLLGPAGAGIFYVKKKHYDLVKPTLLGSWNVISPDFIAQDEIAFYEGGRRYEPGTLNIPGIVGVAAALRLLLDIGVENIGERILHLRAFLVEEMRALGFELYIEECDLRTDAADANRSGIMTFTHPSAGLNALYHMLLEHGVTTSLRKNRQGKPLLRFSPHFYNTEDEMLRVVGHVKAQL